MEDSGAILRNGPYLNLPFSTELEAIRADARTLPGMLERLGRIARKKLVLAIPFFEAHVLDKWLDIWTSQNPNLRIVVIHRQEPHGPSDERRIRGVLHEWTNSGRVEFRTYPERNMRTGRIRRDQPTFHCKIIDPNTGQIILLTSNLTAPARTRNVEAAYVFSPEQAHDFRAVLDHLQRNSVADPFATQY